VTVVAVVRKRSETNQGRKIKCVFKNSSRLGNDTRQHLGDLEKLFLSLWDQCVGKAGVLRTFLYRGEMSRKV